jgi:predicted metal-binding membrane protein
MSAYGKRQADLNDRDEAHCGPAISGPGAVCPLCDAGAEMATTSSAVAGLVLIAAGLYQWTPLKDACLRQCRAPIAFLSSHGGFRSDPFGALRLGIEHGAYCLGCCWALMALLFVGGVMNIACIGGVAMLVLLEKTVPAGRLIPRISGMLLGGAGIWLLFRERHQASPVGWPGGALPKYRQAPALREKRSP